MQRQQPRSCLLSGGVSLYADIRSESDSVSKHSVETADKARLENREEKTYEQLSFSHTDTKAYEDSYIPKGDDYFTEDSVLEDTDFFADVTVLSARLDSDSAHYTLKITALYQRQEKKAKQISPLKALPLISCRKTENISYH